MGSTLQKCTVCRKARKRKSEKSFGHSNTPARLYQAEETALQTEAMYAIKQTASMLTTLQNSKS